MLMLLLFLSACSARCVRVRVRAWRATKPGYGGRAGAFTLNSKKQSLQLVRVATSQLL